MKIVKLIFEKQMIIIINEKWKQEIKTLCLTNNFAYFAYFKLNAQNKCNCNDYRLTQYILCIAK